MSLSQLIYTSTCTAAMTPKMAYQVAAQSVGICQQLGLKGRVFANNQQALAMTEGPTQLVKQYFQAVSADPLVQSIFLHSDRQILKNEFSDYSVWLNLDTPMEFSETVCHLTPHSMQGAMPENISVRLRIMIEAYLTPELLVG